MNIETIIQLDKFVPRDYQREVILAIERDGYKKVLLNFHRRAGKDVVAFNIMIRAAIEKVGVYFYCLPTYSQGRKVIWDGILSNGSRFLDFIPGELIAHKNNTEMKLTLKNGSIIQIVGSDTASQTLVGTNPQGIVFSEWSRSDPSAYTFLRPALVYNNAWAIFISTPFGKNHMYEMAQIAQHNPKEWFSSTKTILDTGVISLHSIEKEKHEGLISDDLIQQEYFGSYEAGAEGSYYAKYIQKMVLDGHLADVPWEPSFKVHTAWDLGVHDKTTIIMFQAVGQIIRIIDYYENCDKGLDHYAKILQEKAYIWGKHFAPHDIAVRELSTGLSRIELARRMGISFNVLPNIPVEDGIELAKTTFQKLWIDNIKCSKLIKSLENYRREWDPKKKVYQQRALHDEASHACFVGETLIKTPNGDIPIRDIKQGDYVLTPLGSRKVLKTHKILTNELCRIKLSDTTIECTPEHEIFCQKGLVYSDALRYNDILEKYSKHRSWIWQKIFGYFLKEQDLNGFKKTILSRKMEIKSSIMDSLIDGLEITSEVGMPKKANQPMMHQPYSEPYGCITMEKFPQDMSFITKMEIEEITKSKILNVLTESNISSCTPICVAHGCIHKIAKTFSRFKELKQQNGMEAKKVSNGIENMHQSHCLYYKEKDIQKNVKFVTKTFQEKCFGKNIVLMLVKRNIEFVGSWTLLIALAVYAKLYSIVINTLLRKHVVESVQLYQCDITETVYDLTVEHDHCYYANGYLVSNSDAFRYMCMSLPKTRDQSPDDLDKRYAEVMQGNAHNIPRPFQDPNSMF